MSPALQMGISFVQVRLEDSSRAGKAKCRRGLFIQILMGYLGFCTAVNFCNCGFWVFMYWIFSVRGCPGGQR